MPNHNFMEKISPDSKYEAKKSKTKIQEISVTFPEIYKRNT